VSVPKNNNNLIYLGSVATQSETSSLKVFPNGELSIGEKIYSTLFNSNKPLSKLGMDKYSAIVCALHPFQVPRFQKQKVGFKATHGWQVDIVRR
jgi:hypothetical protein